MESISKTPVETQLLGLCEKILEPQGFRAVDVDCRVGPRSLVRVFIERIPGTGATTEPAVAGATLDQCAEASRLLGDALETVEFIPSPFDLEVSSPGLDRRLRLGKDFESVVGETVKLKLRAAIEGLGANVTGTLVKVEPGAVTVEVSKRQWPIPLDGIKEAKRVWKF